MQSLCNSNDLTADVDLSSFFTGEQLLADSMGTQKDDIENEDSKNGIGHFDYYQT